MTYLVPSEQTLIDEVGNVKYIGTAPSGALKSQDVWKIQRLVTTGSLTEIQWADDNESADNSWDDRVNHFPPVQVGPYVNTYSTLFDGINDVMNIPIGNLATIAGGDHTVSTWFKILNTGTQYLFLIGSSAGTTSMLSSLNISATQIFFSCRDDASNNLTAIGSATLIPDVWYNFTAIRSGLTCRIYLNGAFLASGNVASFGTCTVNQASIGCRRANTNTAFFSGVVNQLSIFNKSLSQAEVLEIWNNGKPIAYTQLSSYANLKAFWAMGNADVYPTITDKIGGDNGTLVNMNPSSIIASAP